MWGKKEVTKEYKVRQSERISLVLPIRVTGTNFFGDAFQCEGNTDLVSQHGARIRLKQKLAPDQEITIHCIETGKKAAAQVVASVNGASDGPLIGKSNAKSKENVYGVMLKDPQAHPWGINFSPRGDSVGAVGRIVLECMVCHSRDLAYLDGFELEVLESNGTVSRFCKRCLDTSMWRKSFDSLPDAAAAAEGVPKNGNGDGKKQERRRQARHNVRLVACIRSRKFGEELAKVRNVSRSGLCFEGRRHYEKGAEIQVAIPYASGGGNIFVPARIARLQPVSRSGLFLYGVEYARRETS